MMASWPAAYSCVLRVLHGEGRADEAAIQISSKAFDKLELYSGDLDFKTRLHTITRDALGN